ncbi:UNVERIFIED_CONTAM: hypothetical protein K2H54_034949 [Gekko kuhli]
MHQVLVVLGQQLHGTAPQATSEAVPVDDGMASRPASTAQPSTGATCSFAIWASASGAAITQCCSAMGMAAGPARGSDDAARTSARAAAASTSWM